MEWHCLFLFLLLNAASAGIRENFNTGTKISNKRQNYADAIADEPNNSKHMYSVFVEKESNMDKPKKNSENTLDWMSRNNEPAIGPHGLKHREMVRVFKNGIDFESMSGHHAKNFGNPFRLNKKLKHRRLKNHGRKFKNRRIEQMMHAPINRIPPNGPNMMIKVTKSRFSPDQKFRLNFMGRTPNVPRMLEDEPSRLTLNQDRSSGLMSVISDLRRMIEDKSSQLSRDHSGSDHEETEQLDFEADETTSTGPMITESKSNRLDLDEDQSSDFLVASVTPRTMIEVKTGQWAPDNDQASDLNLDETLYALKNNLNQEELTSLAPEEEGDNFFTQPSNRTVTGKAKKISFSKRISTISRLFSEIRKARTRKISNYTMTEEKRNSSLGKVIKSEFSSVKTSKIHHVIPGSENSKERTKKSLDRKKHVHVAKSSTESNWIQEILKFFKENPEILEQIMDEDPDSYFPTHASIEVLNTKGSCLKTQATPTTKKTQKLIPKKTQKLIPKKTQKLTTKMVQKPTTKKVQKQTAKKEQKPAAKKEQKPTKGQKPIIIKKGQKPTGKEEKKLEPTSKKKLEPTSKKKLEPTSKKKLEPTSKKKLEPTSKKKLKPTLKKKLEPASEMEQEPSSETKIVLTSEMDQEPSSEIEEKPSSETEKEPTSDIEQEPSSEMKIVLTSEMEQEPSSETEQEPTSDIEQGPSSEMKIRLTSEMEQEPSSETKIKLTSKMEQCPTSKMEQCPTSELERDSTFEVEEERDFEMEQETTTEMEQETTTEMEQETATESTTAGVPPPDRLELALRNTSNDNLKDIMKTIDELKEVLENEREEPKRHHDPLFSLSDYVMMGGTVIFTIWMSFIMCFVFLAFRKVDQLRGMCTQKAKKGESSGGGG